MTTKRERTRESIIKESYTLFAGKGFKQVTMKDVCEITGMSRGGLYSHFSGTDKLFEAVLEKITENSATDFQTEIKEGTSAVKILEKTLDNMEEEMKHPEDSLSIALYEYAETVNTDVMERLERNAKEKWKLLIHYGVKRGEFQDVNVDEIVNMILYSYQGVRMWSRIIPMKPKTIRSITDHIRKQFIENGETTINGSELLDQMDSYDEWLKSVTDNISPDTVNPAWVVTDTYFAFDEDDNIVGIIDLRHELNDFLKDFGNCGYSVRPSERRKGYATEMLKLILERASQIGMGKIQLSVERSNEASVNMIYLD